MKSRAASPTDFVSEGDLSAIIAAAPGLSSITANSYSHPNGFIKIPLVRGSNGSSIRLHYWPESTSSDGNIHSHRWDMTSHILHGRYRAVEYEEDERGTIVQKYSCSENAEGVYQLNSVGPANLREIAVREQGPRSAYHMPAGNVHRVVSVLEPPVFSLVICSEPKSLNSYIYSQMNSLPANPPATPVPEMLVDELMRWVRSYDASSPNHCV